MSDKKRRRRRRRRRPDRSRKSEKSRRAAGGLQLVTPEGDALTFTSAHFEHNALAEIRRILQEADDFGLDEDLETEPDGSLQFPWYESSPEASSFQPIGRRVLATLVLTPDTLKVEAMSERRMDNCRRRLEQLVGDHIRFVEITTKSVDEALQESGPRPAPQEPPELPPDVIAEFEDRMLRQWIDESIPALGGKTPREAVKTPEGRRQVLELIEHAAQMQKRIKRTPGAFTPDYRKVKKMLGLE